MPIRFVRYRVPSSDLSRAQVPELSYYNCILETTAYAQTYNAHMQSIRSSLKALDAKGLVPPAIRYFYNTQLDPEVGSKLVFDCTLSLEVELEERNKLVESVLTPLFNYLIDFYPAEEVTRLEHVAGTLPHEIKIGKAAERTFSHAREAFLTSSSGAEFGYARFFQAATKIPNKVEVARARLKSLCMMFNILQYLRADKILINDAFETAEDCPWSLLSETHRQQHFRGMSADEIRDSYFSQLIMGRTLIQQRHNTDVMPQFDADAYMGILDRTVASSAQNLSLKAHLRMRKSMLKKENEFWAMHTRLGANPFTTSAAAVDREIWFTTNVSDWYRKNFTVLFTQLKALFTQRKELLTQLKDLLTQRYGIRGNLSDFYRFESRSHHTTLDKKIDEAFLQFDKKIGEVFPRLDKKIDEVFLRECSSEVDVLQAHHLRVHQAITEIINPALSRIPVLKWQNAEGASSDLTRLPRMSVDSQHRTYFATKDKTHFVEMDKVRRDKFVQLQGDLHQTQWKTHASYAVNEFAYSTNILSSTHLQQNFLTLYSHVRTNEIARLDLCQRFASFMDTTMHPHLWSWNGEDWGWGLEKEDDVQERSITMAGILSRLCPPSLELVNRFLNLIEDTLIQCLLQKRGDYSFLCNKLTEIKTNLENLRDLIKPLSERLDIFSKLSRKDLMFWTLPEIGDINAEAPGMIRYGLER